MSMAGAPRGRPSPMNRVLGAGGCEIMYAIRSYADEAGDHRCDVFNPEGSIVHTSCIVVNGNSNKIGAPSEAWSGDLDGDDYPLVVVLTRSGGRSPIVLSRIDNPEIYYEPTVTGPQGSGSSSGAQAQSQGQGSAQNNNQSGPPAGVTVNDVVIQNDDSRIVLKDKASTGDVHVIADQNVKITALNGIVQIDKNGDTSDGPVLADAYAKRDAEILTHLTKLNTWLGMLYTWSQQAVAPVPVATFTAGTSPPLPPDALDPADVRSSILRLASEVESAAP